MIPSDLEGLRQQNPDAWDRVYTELNTDLLASCRRTLRNFDDAFDRADDTCQKIWCKALERIHQFKGDHKTFRGWLWGIARNACNDEMRNHIRNPRASQQDLDSLTACRASVYDEEESSELMSFLDSALSVLDPKCRLVIELSHVEDLSGAEIAEAVGISEGNVNVRLKRARDQIQALFEVFYRGKSKQDAINSYAKNGVSKSKLKKLFSLFEGAAKILARDNR